MRLASALVAFSIICSTSGLSSDAGGRRRGRDVRPNTPRMSSVATTTAEDTRARKRKAPGAPLVDSALLRFVSTQKKQQEKRLRAVEEKRASKSSVSAASSILKDETASFDDRPVLVDSLDKAPTSSSILSGEDQTDPWMGQFNRYRVAGKLVSLGADEAEALQAGEKLQSHVLVRTARRRIRMFLRERDSLWNSNEGMTDQLVETGVGGSEVPSPVYGFEDVLDVFVESGFTGKDIAAILTHTPSLALMVPRKSLLDNKSGSEDTEGSKSISVDASSGEALEHAIERAFAGLLLSTLGMRKYDARKVIRTCPGLLSVRGSKAAVQMVSMMTQLGVSTEAIARDKAAIPTLLSRAPADVFRLISFLCSAGVRMPIKSIGPMIRRPASRELLDTVAPLPNKQRLPQPNEDGTIDPTIEAAIWSKTREERTRKINQVYKNMTETARTLRSEIGTYDLSKMIAAYPSVLLLDAESQILSTASYLTDNFGISGGQLASMLTLYPVLLGKDTAEFDKVAEYLLSIGVREFDLERIVRGFPALLTMDVEREMVPVVDYLTSIGVTDVGSFVTRLPAVLGYSVQRDLKPKWEYLNSVCLQARFELMKFPAYFSYPFDRVIKARYDYLAVKEIPRQLLPVDAVLRHGDVEFATKIARDVDGGKVFRNFSENRKRKSKSGPPKKRRRKPNKRKVQIKRTQ